MNYIYVLAGTIISMIFVAQILAFAASTKKKKVYAGKRHSKKDDH